MVEHRPWLVLIGLTWLCISIWQMALPKPKAVAEMQQHHSTAAFVIPAHSSIAKLMPDTFFISPYQERHQQQRSLSNANSTLTDAALTLDMLPKTDYNQLIDLVDFKYTISQKSCSNQSPTQPLLLIMVHSAPEHWRKRMVIRDTWGSSEPIRTRLIFLMGAVTSTDIQQRIEQENRFYGDIVQGSFIDAYRNLTYKHVMALKWYMYECPTASYILKTDDDVFIQMPHLVDMLDMGVRSETGPRKQLLFCSKITQAMVKRSFRSKWRVSPNEYGAKYYPDHCPGFAILYSSDVAAHLYAEAQNTPYFWVDDVFITGVVASRLNITVTPITSYYLNATQKERILSGRGRDEDLVFIFAQPDMSETDIKELWKAVLPKKSDNR